MPGSNEGLSLTSTAITFAFMLSVASFATFDAVSAAAPEFPQIDSSVYCGVLTSKMLDKADQSREMAQCLSFEATSRGRLSAQWPLVTPAGAKECLKPAPRRAGPTSTSSFA